MTDIDYRQIFYAIAGSCISDAAGHEAAWRVMALIEAATMTPERIAAARREVRTAAELEALPNGSVLLGGPPVPDPTRMVSPRFAATKDNHGMWVMPWYVKPEDGEKTSEQMVFAGRTYRVIWENGVDR